MLQLSLLAALAVGHCNVKDNYWVQARNGNIPGRPVKGGHEAIHNGREGDALYVCKGRWKGGVHPGKIRSSFASCNIAYGEKETGPRQYKVLAGLPGDTFGWHPGHKGSIHNDAIVAGRESGKLFFVCRIGHRNGIHMGKIRSDFSECHVPYGGKVVKRNRYDVLYARKASICKQKKLIDPIGPHEKLSNCLKQCKDLECVRKRCISKAPKCARPCSSAMPNWDATKSCVEKNCSKSDKRIIASATSQYSVFSNKTTLKNSSGGSVNIFAGDSETGQYKCGVLNHGAENEDVDHVWDASHGAWAKLGGCSSATVNGSGAVSCCSCLVKRAGFDCDYSEPPGTGFTCGGQESSKTDEELEKLSCASSGFSCTNNCVKASRLSWSPLCFVVGGLCFVVFAKRRRRTHVQ